jgi:hypothetical protein
LQEFLAKLKSDPSDLNAIEQLEALGSALNADEAAAELRDIRETLRRWGQLEAVERLLEVQIAAATDDSSRADLLLAKGHLYVDDFLDEAPAVLCLERVPTLRPDDQAAAELLETLGSERQSWRERDQAH